MVELKSYTYFIDKYPSEISFVVGAGTSLLGIYNHPYKNKIHNHIVISVNSSIMMMPWEDGSCDRRIWISNDSLSRRWSWWVTVKKCIAYKIVRDSWKAYFEEIPDFFVFSPRPTPENIINPDDTGLAYCSSVPSAIDLSIQMGCKYIFVLGVDQYMIGDKSHYWQYWPKNKWPTRIDGVMATHNQQKDVFKYNDVAYPALKKFAENKNVKIYNCNPQSKVEVFDKITFDEALKIL